MSEAEKKLELAQERLAKEVERNARSSAKLTQAFEDLNNITSDKLAKRLTESAVKLGVLNEEQVKLIKTNRDLVDILKDQEEIASKLLKAQKITAKAESDYAAAKKGSNKKEIGNTKKALDAANQSYNLELKNLKLTKDQADALIKSVEAYNEHTIATIKATNSITNYRLHVDKVRVSYAKWAAEAITVAASMKLMKGGIEKFIDQFNKASSVGLQSAILEIGNSALKLSMSFDEFSEAISKNRDIINAMGGGVKGIESFGKYINDASEGLKHLGSKEANKATARFASTLKLAGESFDPKDFETNKKTMKKYQDNFTKMSGMYGETYESYAALMESQIEEDTIKQKTIALGKTGAHLMMSEIAIRTENLKAMGLSNEEIKSFSKRLEDVFNPNKNNQEQKTKDAMNFRTDYSFTSQQPGNEHMKAYSSQVDEITRLILRGADGSTITNWLSEHQDMVKAFSQGKANTNKRNNEAAISKDGPGSFYSNHLTNMLGDNNALTAAVMQTGNAVNIKRLNGAPTDPTSKAYQDMAIQATAMAKGLNADLNSQGELIISQNKLADNLRLLVDATNAKTAIANNAAVELGAGITTYLASLFGNATWDMVKGLTKRLTGLGGATAAAAAGATRLEVGAAAAGVEASALAGILGGSLLAGAGIGAIYNHRQTTDEIKKDPFNSKYDNNPAALAIRGDAKSNKQGGAMLARKATKSLSVQTAKEYLAALNSSGDSSIDGYSKEDLNTIIKGGGARLASAGTAASPTTNQAPSALSSGANSIRGMTAEQTTKFTKMIADKESSDNYQNDTNPSGFIGRYQMGAAALLGAGLIKKDKYDAAPKSREGNLINQRAFINNPSNWTIAGGKEEFLKNNALQDQAFRQFTNNNIKRGYDRGALNAGSTSQEIMAFAAAAHIGGADGASNLVLKNIDSKDGNNTPTSSYWNSGLKLDSVPGTSIMPVSKASTSSPSIVSSPAPNKIETLNDTNAELRKQTDLLNQLVSNSGNPSRSKMYQPDKISGMSTAG